MPNIKQRLLALFILVAGLGLYSPLYKQLYQLYVQSNLEHTPKNTARKKPCKTRFHRDIRSVSNSQIGVAISPDSRELYRLVDNGIQIANRETREQQYFELPPEFPKLSWGTDLAYDTKRDLVSLVSLGGEGYFYRFDVKQRRWLDARSLNNLDLERLTYDSENDRYVALTKNFGQPEVNLLFFSSNGELMFQKNISDRIIGLERLYDRKNGMPIAVNIWAKGNNIALMTQARDSMQYVWYYNLSSDIIRSGHSH